MWLLVRYRHTAPFSLKPSFLTSSGARTLVVPTMYAVKMALIDAAYRAGLNGEDVFPWVKGLAIRFSPPACAVVTNTFIKIQKEARNDSQDTDGEDDASEPPSLGAVPAFSSTMAYREFVVFNGELNVAIDITPLTSEQASLLQRLTRHVNYFGKRGGFVQWVGTEQSSELPAGFGFSPGHTPATLDGSYVTQTLDDFGPGVRFGAINSFSEDRASLGRDRVLVPVAIPYRKVSSSRRYTFYRRVS